MIENNRKPVNIFLLLLLFFPPGVWCNDYGIKREEKTNPTGQSDQDVFSYWYLIMISIYQLCIFWYLMYSVCIIVIMSAA